MGRRLRLVAALVCGFAHKSQVLAEHGKDAGTDHDAIVWSANFNSVIGESEADVADRIARLRARIHHRHNRTGHRSAETATRPRM